MGICDHVVDQVRTTLAAVGITSEQFTLVRRTEFKLSVGAELSADSFDGVVGFHIRMEIPGCDEDGLPTMFRDCHWVYIKRNPDESEWSLHSAKVEGGWREGPLSEDDEAKIYRSLATSVAEYDPAGFDGLAVFLLAYPISGAAAQAGLEVLTARGYDVGPMRARLAALQRAAARGDEPSVRQRHRAQAAGGGSSPRERAVAHAKDRN